MRLESRSILQVALALSTLGLGGGCELAIPLVVAGTTSGPSDPMPGEFIPATMTMDLAESDGYVYDEPVGEVELFVPFELDLLSGFLLVGVEGSSSATTSIQIQTCDLARAGGDPYGGLDQPLPSEGMRDPLASSPCGDPAELIGACTDFGDCIHPASAQIERVATPAGDELRVDATWDNGNPLFLRFVEVP